MVNDPVDGQTVVPKDRVDSVLAKMPEGGKLDWMCGNGCYGFVPDVGRAPAETPTVWVISAECADIRQIPRELVREAMYR